MKTVFFLVGFFLSCPASFSQSSGEKELKADRKGVQKERAKFDWKSFDKTSTISIDSIKSIALQGLWKSYYGLFKFGDMVNSMNLTQPFIIEVSGETVRRNADSNFEPFTIQKNQLISNDGKEKGYINKITATLLVITWESGDNFTRYYYEK